MSESALNFGAASHYDRVTAAWTLLLGEELHYGVFATGDEPLPVATQALTDLMRDAARVHPGAQVLDIGCGTGAQACHLATTDDAVVTGITTSREGVSAAQGRAAGLGLGDRVRFEVRDGTDNGLPDASFDIAWVLESSHLMRRRDRLVSEIARVLRPGGRVALCDIMRRRTLTLDDVRELREPLALLRAVFGDARMEPLEEYRRLFEAAGLEVDLERDLTAETRETFARWRANAETHRDEVVALIGADGHAEFAASCDVLEGFWDDGTLGYGIIAARKPEAA